MERVRRSHRGERGGLNFTTIVLLLVVAAGVWGAFKFGPYYLEYNRVRRLTKAACAYWLNVEESLPKVKEKLDRDLQQAMVESIDASYVEFEKVNRDEVTAYVSYDVEVEMPFGKPRVLHFEFDHTEERKFKTD